MHTTNSAQTTENGGELCLVQLILEREWKNTCRNSVLIFKIFLCYSYATLCFPWYVAVFVASLAPMPLIRTFWSLLQPRFLTSNTMIIYIHWTLFTWILHVYTRFQISTLILMSFCPSPEFSSHELSNI